MGSSSHGSTQWISIGASFAACSMVKQVLRPSKQPTSRIRLGATCGSRLSQMPRVVPNQSLVKRNPPSAAAPAACIDCPFSDSKGIIVLYTR